MSFDAPLLRIRAAVRILKGEFQMKQYQKPEVFYENFVLAEHIAQCDYKLGNADTQNCAIILDRYPYDGGDLAQAGVFSGSACTTIVKEEFYCYTNGVDLPKIFQS